MLSLDRGGGAGASGVLLGLGIVLGCSALNPAFGASEDATGAASGASGDAPTSTTNDSVAQSSAGTGSPSGEAGNGATGFTTDTTTGTVGTMGPGSSGSTLGGRASSEAGGWPLKPSHPCNFSGELPASLAHCYTFAARGLDPGEDQVGEADLIFPVSLVTDGPTGWGGAVSCAPAACGGEAIGELADDGFALEVWGRLTATEASESNRRWNLFSMEENGDRVGVEVWSDMGGALSVQVELDGHSLELNNSNSTDYFCVGVRWSPASAPRATHRTSAGFLRPDWPIAGASADLQFVVPTLRMGEGTVPFPAELIGVRIWTESNEEYCSQPMVP